MQKIVYKRNKASRIKGLAFSFIVLIIGIGIGVWLYITKETVSNAMAVFSLILLLLGIFLVFYNLFYNKSVVVNSDGIYTYVNSIKLIPWKYIEGFEIKSLQNKTYLIVLINDPKSFILQKKLRARELMKLNIKEIGNPVAIPETEFNKPIEIIKIELETYKKLILTS